MTYTRTTLITLLSSVFVAGVLYAAPHEKANAGAKVPEAKPGYIEPKISHEQYGAMKIVVPITTDDEAVHGMKLRNIENSLDAVAKWGGSVQNTVILYAKGVSLLKNPGVEIQKKIDALKARGVRFYVCDNTLREQGIDFHQLYHVVDRDIVPSGFAEIAYLQSKKNYVVDPMN